MTLRPLRSSALLLAAALCFTSTGCILGGGNSPSKGDAPAGKPIIPAGAKLVTEGRDQLDYTADADGDVFVQDVRSETMILARKLYKGQKLIVSPRENRVRVDGQIVSSTDLKKSHAHRIYMLRDVQPGEDSNNARNGRDGVPVGARLIGEDINNPISFRAEQPGRAYIVDADKHKLIETLAVGKNQRFTFSPATDRVLIDNRPSIERDFDPKTSYRIYFDH